MQARVLLTSNDLPRARQMLQAAEAQLMLRPVSPGQGQPTADVNPSAQDINAALRWLDAGEPARALSMVNAAVTGLTQQHASNAISGSFAANGYGASVP